jgi:hypothetical protein
MKYFWLSVALVLTTALPAYSQTATFSGKVTERFSRARRINSVSDGTRKNEQRRDNARPVTHLTSYLAIS